MKLEFSRQFFENYANVKFHDNLFSGIRVVQCELTDGRTEGLTDGKKDTKKVVVAFWNFAKRDKNVKLTERCCGLSPLQ